MHRLFPLGALNRKGLGIAPSLFFAMLGSAVIEMRGGPVEAASEVWGHRLFVEHEGDMRAIVHAKNGRVQVEDAHGEREWSGSSEYAFVRDRIPSVGRITVYESAGVGRQIIMGEGQAIRSSSRSSISFDLVADRDLADVYVVMFYHEPGKSTASYLGFGDVGDMVAGKRVKRTVKFLGSLPNVRWYHYEFYSGQDGIESLDFDHVAVLFGTTGLQIPWEDRLRSYLRGANVARQSRIPMLFHFELGEELEDQLRELPISILRLELEITKEGSTKLIRVLDDLDAGLVSALESAAAHWRFFPAVDEKKPISTRVIFPIRF